MRLRATVRKSTGATSHILGERIGGVLELTPITVPQSVEVVVEAGAVYLLRLDIRGECVADTWHVSVEEAKEQAKFEFGIEECDWINIEPRH